MHLANNKNIFCLDQHFQQQHSLPREKRFVAWLDEVKGDAEAIFLVGDLFDFGSNIKLLYLNLFAF
jgi:UDP-2,3-diacylglucosamine hydrolase